MIPTPYELTVREPVAGAEDIFGAPEDGWAEHPWWVHGVAPGAMAEPAETNRDASEVAWTVVAPKSPLVPTTRGQVLVDGHWHDVVGTPDDWTRGPWHNPVSGVIVELRRVDG